MVGQSGTEKVFSSGLSTSGQVGSGGSELVLSGGEAGGLTVDTGGSLNSYPTFTFSRIGSAVESGLTVSGGSAFVLSGGMATGLVVAGGTVSVYEAGISSTMISNGGSVILDFDATAVQTTVSSGGSLIDLGDVGSAVNTQLLSGSFLVISSFAGYVSGFSDTVVVPGAAIDFPELPFGSDGSVTFQSATNTLAVSEGGYTVSLSLTGSYAGEYFHGMSDGTGGTLVTLNTVPCFCRGTLIATDRGDHPVETLSVGDRVLVASGIAEAVRWIGRRSYAGRFLTANPKVQPIRFRAGSLGDGLPRRDLLVPRARDVP